MGRPPSVDEELARLVLVAHADAWQVLGGLFAAGGAAECRGARMMASGLALGEFNGADVTGADIDLDAVRAFYAARAVPWGLRVPLAIELRVGRRVAVQQLMGARAGTLRVAAPPAGVQIAQAAAEDLDAVHSVDSAAFQSSSAHTRQWLRGLLAAPRPVVRVALASRHGRCAGTAYSVSADGLAGPSVLIAGVGVVPEHRGVGIAAALVSWLIDRAGGGRLAHLQSENDAALRVYERLGFARCGSIAIHVDV